MTLPLRGKSSIDCDRVIDLIHGDKVPRKGVCLRGALAYEDGRLIGRAVQHQTRLELGPTGEPVLFERVIVEPLELT